MMTSGPWLAAFSILVVTVQPSHAGLFTKEFDAQKPSPTNAPATPNFTIQPSQILLRADIDKTAIVMALEKAIPILESGARGDPVGNPVVDDVLTWEFSRTDLNVSLDPERNALTAQAGITGFVRVKGNVRLIRGSLGKLLGKLNPTNIPFSTHADLTAVVSVSSAPKLQPNWRIAPNFSLDIDVLQAEIPIVEVGNVSVRGHVREGIEGKRAELVGRINNEVANNPEFEHSARTEWEKLCKAHKLALGWLVVEPQSAQVAQPKMFGDKMSLAFGISAVTRIDLSVTEPRPSCAAFPAAIEIVEMPEKGRAHISVPAFVSWETVNETLTQEFAGKNFDTDDESANLTIKQISAESSGDRVLLTARVQAATSGWFGPSAEGTVYVWSQPKLSANGHSITFENVSVDAASDSVLGSLAAGIVSLQSQFIAQKIHEHASIDLSQYASKMKEQADAASAELARTLQNNATINIQTKSPRLIGLSITSSGIALEATAEAAVDAAITSLKFP